MEENVIIREVLIYFALKYKGNWDQIHTAINLKEDIDLDFLRKELNKIECNIVTILDKDYPNRLKKIYQPPFVLFYYGDLSLLDNDYLLGVVGSRKVSDYGMETCCKLICDLKDREIVIVSGLAKGVDAIAHESAIRNNLKTVAVLGTGIDCCYPKENFYLYQKIKNNGLLISEYPYKELVSKDNFVLRNRLIAGLSDKLLIPELQDKSGTLVTIRFALNYGKEIFVVPTSIFDNTFNNELIFQGATPIFDGKDIFE